MVSYGHVLSSPLHQFRCPKWGWHYFCCQETLDEHCRDLVDQLVRSPPTVWRPSNSEKAQGGKLWTDATIHNMQKMIKDVSTIVNQQYNSVYIYVYTYISTFIMCVYMFQYISTYFNLWHSGSLVSKMGCFSPSFRAFPGASSRLSQQVQTVKTAKMFWVVVGYIIVTNWI